MTDTRSPRASETYEEELRAARKAMDEGQPRRAHRILSIARRRAVRDTLTHRVSECTYLMSLAAGAAGDVEAQIAELRRLARSRGTAADYQALAEALTHVGRVRAARNAEIKARSLRDSTKDMNATWPQHLGHAIAQISALMADHPRLRVTLQLMAPAEVSRFDVASLFYAEVSIGEDTCTVEIESMISSVLARWADREGVQLTVIRATPHAAANRLAITVQNE